MQIEHVVSYGTLAQVLGRGAMRDVCNQPMTILIIAED